MKSLDQVVSLCKRRGFIFPGSDIYGGLANSWDFGPVGVELKNNIKQLWWRMFVQDRDDIVGIDASLIMNPRVWEASGHVTNFSDPLVECKHCNTRFRVDNIVSDEVLASIGTDNKQRQDYLIANIDCPNCNKRLWDIPKQFNLMFQTHIGPVENNSSTAYLRPETAQAMFVDFKLVQEIVAKSPPFGIAQIGKAFRNEITPGNFIFRTREFEQMEIEYFFPEPKTDSEWQKQFELWREQMWNWINCIGLSQHRVHELEVPNGERAHYSKRTIDFEYDFPFGRKELYGLAYRTNFDLLNHEKASGKSMKYRNPQTGEEYVPHVIEPTWGVDRTVLAILCESYNETGEGDKKRVYLSLPPKLAPFKVAIFPLVKNKPDLVDKARVLYSQVKKHYTVAWDDRGNVGKRYYAQDEIGTPWCVTVDYQTLDDNTVTIRERDTTQQERIEISQLLSYIQEKMN